MLSLGPCQIDWESSEVRHGSKTVRLTPIQWKVLRLLVKARGKVVPKDTFHTQIWKDNLVADSSLTQTVFLLRRAIGKFTDGTEIIETIPKRGYRLAAKAIETTPAQPLEIADLNRRFQLGGDHPYRLLVESIEDYAIYMLDCSGRILTWNRGADLNKGFNGSEVLGRHYSLFFPPEDVAAKMPERELAVAATEGKCSGEGWRIRKNGERFWASFTVTALRATDGKLLGFAKIVKDLSERKREEDALRRAEASARRERDRLNAAAESSMDALYICEPVRNAHGDIEDFVFTYLNHNVESMVSLSKDTLLGSKMCELFPVNREVGLFDAYRQVALTGETYHCEMPIEAENVKSKWIKVRAVRLEEGIAITATDITERKELEARIASRYSR